MTFFGSPRYGILRHFLLDRGYHIPDLNFLFKFQVSKASPCDSRATDQTSRETFQKESEVRSQESVGNSESRIRIQKEFSDQNPRYFFWILTPDFWLLFLKFQISTATGVMLPPDQTSSETWNIGILACAGNGHPCP